MQTFRESVSAVQPVIFAPQPGRQEVWRAVKAAVREYAREPSNPHAQAVERALAALRRHEERQRAPAGS